MICPSRPIGGLRRELASGGNSKDFGVFAKLFYWGITALSCAISNKYAVLSADIRNLYHAEIP